MNEFENLGNIYIAGDFNCRLSASGDQNPDPVATAEFEGSALSSLTNLNSTHAFKIPTYRNVTQKCKIGESVIDLCLTNSPKSILSFQVLTEFLGTTAHSAHRAIVVKIRGTYKDETCLLYTSPSPRDLSTSRMPSSA